MPAGWIPRNNNIFILQPRPHALTHSPNSVECPTDCGLQAQLIEPGIEIRSFRIICFLNFEMLQCPLLRSFAFTPYNTTFFCFSPELRLQHGSDHRLQRLRPRLHGAFQTPFQHPQTHTKNTPLASASRKHSSAPRRSPATKSPFMFPCNSW